MNGIASAKCLSEIVVNQRVPDSTLAEPIVNLDLKDTTIFVSRLIVLEFESFDVI